MRTSLFKSVFAICFCCAVLSAVGAASLHAQDTRLLRQPAISQTRIAFTYGADIWTVDRSGNDVRRLTCTPAVESDPHFSPDGEWIAFTSNRSGAPAVYIVPARGGEPVRLTWHPVSANVRGWTPDGQRVLYCSGRDCAPTNYRRLWTVSRDGGPASVLPAPMAFRGSYAPDGQRIIIDRVGRWDTEWRNYRGGQNTPLTILDLKDLQETRLPNELTTDTWPVWLGDTIYFLSDRDHATNVWTYDIDSGDLAQLTHFRDADIKTLTGGPAGLVIEQDGWIHLLDPATGSTTKLDITIHAEFPWAAPRWTDVSRDIAFSTLSPSGKRALFEARGEIFTVPVEHGDARNMTRSAGAADRAPIWSPDGSQVAWFSDEGSGYRLLIAAQDGLSKPREIKLGDARMAFVPVWSPDGSRIAFVDGTTGLRVVEVDSGKLITAAHDGSGFGSPSDMAPTWSPDSNWLAYSRFFPNNLRRIMVWSLDSGKSTPVTNDLAHAVEPAWDRNGDYLYFLASTDLGLASGFANTSSIGREATFGVYLTLLSAEQSSPFPPRSDEEEIEDTEKGKKDDKDNKDDDAENEEETTEVTVEIDFVGIEDRILSIPMPVSDYGTIVTGPEDVFFVTEREDGQPGSTLHRFQITEREADTFASGVRSVSVSADGTKLMYRSGDRWFVVSTGSPPGGDAESLNVSLNCRLVPAEEWPQIFDEAWRIERDFFYAPNLHGADWDAVYKRYEPLVSHVRHRADLNYILDQVGGELCVGHSFVGGGDMPETDTSRVGMLGADLIIDKGFWRIDRIYTSESWNPDLRAPLDQPGLKVEAGNYLLSINGVELTADDNPFRLLDGTADRQTVLRLNDRPKTDDAWTITVVPARSENAMRRRAWVENNRRQVEELSDGKLAYVWVPNTGGQGFQYFNRYYFAQQDRLGAVIDERFNGGGWLDDYMVDLMRRDVRGGISNESPEGPPFRLPIAGILGPKVLLINEMAGSGGDYFPWAFRQLEVGPLIGTRTWGGLVAACVPYRLVDGGTITSPCAAVFDEHSNWVAENEGVPPDIEVLQDARSVAEGNDPQLERAVAEALRLLETEGVEAPVTPAFPDKARRPGG